VAKIRVVVSGTGKMGREILAAVCADPDLEPVGVLEKFSAEEYLSLPDGSGLVHLDKEPQALFARCRPDVVIDFTNAEWAPLVARAALEAGARLVIGTTGLSGELLAELEVVWAEKLVALVAVETKPADPVHDFSARAPAVNADLATKIDYLYKSWRNKKDNDGTTTNLYADDAACNRSSQFKTLDLGTGGGPVYTNQRGGGAW
jgi:4-hydroxy-tetrahydrodipicolinate reductase